MWGARGYAGVYMRGLHAVRNLSITPRLHLDYTSITPRLHTGYISITSRLHLIESEDVEFAPVPCQHVVAHLRSLHLHAYGYFIAIGCRLSKLCSCLRLVVYDLTPTLTLI